MANEKDNLIIFVTEDGEEISLEILEQTTIAGNDYILVAEVEEIESEDSEAYIMKAVSDGSESDMIAYEFVEDEQELASISKIFEELLDDVDLV